MADSTKLDVMVGLWFIMNFMTIDFDSCLSLYHYYETRGNNMCMCISIESSTSFGSLSTLDGI